MTTRSRSTRKIQLAFGTAILAMIAVGTLSYRGMFVSGESARQVQHTEVVPDALQDLLVQMRSMEAAYRGFVLTGNEAYLGPYRDSIGKAKQDQADIRSLTADNPVQQRQLPALDGLIDYKFKFADSVVEVRRTKNLAAAVDAILARTAGQAMIQIQRILGEMQNEEQRLLKLRTAAVNQRVDRTKLVMILGTLLGALIAAAAGWRVHRDSARRTIAEDALRESEQQYRTLLYEVQDYAIFMLDQHGGIVTWNAGAERIMGYEAEEIIGHNFAGLFPPDEVRRGRPKEVRDSPPRTTGTKSRSCASARTARGSWQASPSRRCATPPASCGASPRSAAISARPRKPGRNTAGCSRRRPTR